MAGRDCRGHADHSPQQKGPLAMSKRHITPATDLRTASVREYPELRPVKIANPAVVYDLPPWHGAHDEQIQAMIEKHVEMINQRRQALEDQRAVRRNRNRFVSLIGALIISLMLTWTFQHGYLGPHVSAAFAPYSFVITITLDSVITMYAYLRRY
jgi:hypothetical protein